MLGTGKLLIKVPPTMRFTLDGEMPDYLLAKDLILQTIGEIGVAGATYRAMEFDGDAIRGMNMDGKRRGGGKKKRSTEERGARGPPTLSLVISEPSRDKTHTRIPPKTNPTNPTTNTTTT